MPSSSVTNDSILLYDAIVRKAFSKNVSGGDRLVERELAEELGVSRIPVRDALIRLVAEGVLIRGEKGQGVFVRRYGPEEIRQLYEYREILEGGAARAAARSARGPDLMRMSMICDEMEPEAERFESPRWRELDQRFHEGMAEASGNQRLAHTIKPLLTECFFMFYAPGQWSEEQIAAHKPELAERVIQEHRLIVEMIRDRDEVGAEKAARDHVCWFGDLATRLNISGSLKRSAQSGPQRTGARDYQYRVSGQARSGS